MPTPPRRPLPNPFYVLLLGASALFVVTTFAYLIIPTVAEQAVKAQGANAKLPAFAAWLDRRGPLALGVEIAVMVATGLLAMATDRWFPEKQKPARAAKDAGRAEPT